MKRVEEGLAFIGKGGAEALSCLVILKAEQQRLTFVILTLSIEPLSRCFA
jgi:hypothetical protein